MKKINLLFVLIWGGVISFSVFASGYDKMKIKHREKQQQKYGMYKNEIYNYVDKREIRNAVRNSKQKGVKNIDIGVVNVGKNRRIRKINQAVDGGDVNLSSGAKGKKVRIGVVNVNKKNRRVKKMKNIVDLGNVRVK